MSDQSATSALEADRDGPLRLRAVTVLEILAAFGVLVTGVDVYRNGWTMDLLSAIGVVRLLAVLVCLVVVVRASSGRWVLAAAMGGVATILVVSPPMGLLRGQLGTALLIESGLCVAASAFLPWGWRAQLAVVMVGVASLLAVPMVEGASLIPLQSLGLALCCFGVSVYIAFDQEATRRRLQAFDAQIQESHEEVARLNRRLEKRVAARGAMLQAAGRRFRTVCESLAVELRPNLAKAGRNLQEWESALDSGGTAEAAGLVGRIRGATARMEETLDALLDYVALAERSFELVALDLSRIAGGEAARLKAKDGPRAVEVTIEPGLGAVGDEEAITEVFRNLLDNAWKFSGQCEQARVEVGRLVGADGTPWFFVRDNGVGFDMEHVSNLFRPFMRLEALDSFPGHGMGLARTRRIVERHGGRIEAEAAPGRGTEIRFTLAPDSPVGQAS